MPSQGVPIPQANSSLYSKQRYHCKPKQGVLGSWCYSTRLGADMSTVAVVMTVKVVKVIRQNLN